MNALTKVETPLSLAVSDEDLMHVLRSSLYPGAKDESIKLVLSWCRAQGKDPLKRPVHIVPMSVKTGKKDQKGYDVYEWRDILMPGIGDYRTDAARTGQYAGLSAAEWGEDVTEALDEVTIIYPQWCQISVFRLIDGNRYEFSSGRVWWKETYATKGKSAAPNAMWLKRPRGQLEKCAESQALRRAFPEVGAQPTAEEMEGKSMDDTVDVTPLPVRPKAIEPPTEQLHPQPPEAPKRQHVGSPPETKLASSGAIRTIKTRLDAMNIEEKAVLDDFKLTTLDGISIDQHIAIMDWIGSK